MNRKYPARARFEIENKDGMAWVFVQIQRYDCHGLRCAEFSRTCARDLQSLEGLLRIMCLNLKLR